MAKGTNFKFGTRAPRKSPHMTTEKILETGTWSGPWVLNADEIWRGIARFSLR